MRIQQLKGGTDDGAVFVLVVVLLVAMLAISAFAVDFGQAYSGKRQLSTAADAAALAAASAIAQNASIGCIAGTPGPDLAPGTSAYAAALSAAQQYIAANYPAYLTGGAGTMSLQIGCAAGGLASTGDPTVTVGIGGQSATTLGRITGVDQIGVAGSATVLVGPSLTASGLLPLAVCASYLSAATPGTVVEVDFPKASGKPPLGPPCDPTLNGNWFKIDMSGPNNGAASFESILDGGCQCSETVPFQASSLTGNSSLANIAYDLGKAVTLPVFTTAPSKNGQTTFMFNGFVAGTLCEYNFSSTSNGGGSSISGGTCLPIPTATDYIGLKITDVVSAGSINSNCAFADTTCSTVRTTALVQ